MCVLMEGITMCNGAPGTKSIKLSQFNTMMHNVPSKRAQSSSAPGGGGGGCPGRANAPVIPTPPGTGRTGTARALQCRVMLGRTAKNPTERGRLLAQRAPGKKYLAVGNITQPEKMKNEIGTMN